jgi:cytochrome oxidase assembly protein ShyY1
VARVLLTPKWIGLTVLGLVVIVAFGALSAWQWSRAQRVEVQPVARTVTAVFGEGTLASSDYGARVVAAGTYDAAHQVLVDHGNGAWWVVTPLVLDSGQVLPVARATVRSTDSPVVGDVTAGRVVVTGVAQPYEGDPGTANGTAPGVVDRLTRSGLDWPHDQVAGGWVALESQTPAPAVAYEQVVAPVGAALPAGLRLQNASYAVQWLLFAGFVVFFWARMLRDDLREQVPAAPRERTAPVREVY